MENYFKRYTRLVFCDISSLFGGIGIHANMLENNVCFYLVVNGIHIHTFADETFKVINTLDNTVIDDIKGNYTVYQTVKELIV